MLTVPSPDHHILPVQTLLDAGLVRLGDSVEDGEDVLRG